MISRGNVFPIQGGSWRDGKRKVRKALRGGQLEGYGSGAPRFLRRDAGVVSRPLDPLIAEGIFVELG